MARQYLWERDSSNPKRLRRERAASMRLSSASDLTILNVMFEKMRAICAIRYCIPWDVFRPGFDEENAGDMKVTTRILWRSFFGHDIDVLEKIIRPALRIRQEGYAPDNPVTDYKAALESPENLFPPTS